MNLKDSYDLFVASRETYCSGPTIDNYSNTVRYFLEYLEEARSCSAADIDINSIELFDLNQYSVYLKSKIKNEGHPFCTTEIKKTISSSTRYTYLRDMRTFFNYLFEEEIIDSNPVKKFKMPKRLGKVIEPLTVDEVSLIDEHLKSNKTSGIRNLCIVHLLLDEGMRTSEVYKLKVSDLNFRKNYIVIRNAKGTKNRILPLSAICKKYVSEYIENHRPDVTHDYLICSVEGDPLTQSAIKGLFDRLKVSTGITRIYPHLLRHTFGTSFILGGGSLELCRHYMGHSDIKTTENYLHIANDFRFCENIYRLDEFFKKSFY